MNYQIKLIKRFKIILLGATNSIAITVLNFCLSFLIINLESPELWGEIVQYYIVFNIAFAIISWGQFPYLNKEFSLHTHLIAINWQKSILYRSVFLVIFISIIIIIFPIRLIIFFIVWVLAKYIYDSFTPLIQYHRKYLFSIIVELLGMGMTMIPIILFQSILDIEIFFLWYSIGFVLKSLLLLLYFRKEVFENNLFNENNVFKEVVNYLRITFPFLIIVFSGMIQSKIDLYCVAYFTDTKGLAMYQVLLSLFSVSIFFASLILSPFAKNILRLNKHSLQKLSKKFMLLGIFLSILSLAVIFIIATYLYNFNFSNSIYLLGGFYIWNIYVNLIKVYEYTKFDKQRKLAKYSFIAAAINLLMSIFLTPIIGIEGALLSTVISQYCITFILFKEDISSFILTKFT